MRGLIAFFVRRYVFAISIFLAITLLGAASFMSRSINLLPDIEIAVISVATPYPGASAREVTQQVSEPIEDAVAGLAGIDSVSSTSQEGFSLVVVQFRSSVNSDQAAIDVSREVNAIAGRLPEDAERPSVREFDPNDQPILNVALIAPGERLVAVKQYAEDQLQLRLQRLEGVADVSIISPVEREFQVLLDVARLQSYDLRPGQVVSAIRREAVNIPVGDVQFSNERAVISGEGIPNTLDQVANLYVDSEQGIRVRDVASVRDSSEDIQRYTRVNGQTALLLEVRKRAESNAVTTAARVRERLQTLELPAGYRAQIIGDETEFVASTVRATRNNALAAIVVVSVIVLLFLGRLGAVFSVVLAIPITLAGAFTVFAVLGFTINIITLLALTVAIGLVVDDSIVIAESVARAQNHNDNNANYDGADYDGANYDGTGSSQQQAAIDGAHDVSTAVLAATLSLLAVFLPISFLPGTIGQFFQQFGLTLAATIIFSYLEALFFLTVRLAYLPNPLPLRWREVPQRIQRVSHDGRWVGRLYRTTWLWVGLVVAVGVVAVLFYRGTLPLWNLLVAVAVAIFLPFLLGVLRYIARFVLAIASASAGSLYRVGQWLQAKLEHAYSRALRGVLEHSTITLIGAGLLFASIFIALPRLGFNFTPPTDSGRVNVVLELPAGTNLDRTNALVSQVENTLLQDPFVDTLQVVVGESDSAGGLDSGGSSPERASLAIEMVDLAQRDISAFDYVSQLREQLPPLLADTPAAQLRIAVQQDAGPPQTSDFTQTLTSENLAALIEQSARALEVIQQQDGLTNATSDLANLSSERTLLVRDGAQVGSGLSTADIFNTARLYNLGVQASEVRQGGRDYPIRVQAAPTDITGTRSLLDLPIFAPALSTYIPLSDLARYRFSSEPSTINRTNQTFSVELSADRVNGAAPLSELETSVRERLRQEGIVGADSQVSLSSGAGFDLTGDLQRYAPIAFLLALFLNYLVIASQFNTFRYPLYLLLTVPFALVGAVWMFYLTGTALDVNSTLGFVILVGLVTKNAILLLDVVQKQRDEHDSLKDTLITAGRVRLRPILMTTLTVIAISLPLVLGIGSGSEFRRPLGLVIFGGVVSSALLTLFVVPAAFYRFERDDEEDDAKPQSDTPRASSSLDTRTTPKGSLPSSQ